MRRVSVGLVGPEGALMTRTALREFVFDAFAGNSAPPADEIVPDVWEMDLERTAIRNAFSELDWQEVPAEMFADYRQALFFLRRPHGLTSCQRTLWPPLTHRTRTAPC